MHDGALLSVMPCFSDALRYALSHSCLALSHAVVPCCQSCLAVSDGVMPCCQSWLALSYALLSVMPLLCNCVSCRFATRVSCRFATRQLRVMSFCNTPCSAFALSLAFIVCCVTRLHIHTCVTCVYTYLHTHTFMYGCVRVCAHARARMCVCMFV